MAKFYGTFGFGQSLHKNYVQLEVDCESQAHDKMVQEYGPLWAFIYTEEEFRDQSEQYGLTEVPFGTINTRIRT